MKARGGFVLFASSLALVMLLVVAVPRGDSQSAASGAPFPTGPVTLRVWDTTEKTKATLFQEVLNADPRHSLTQAAEEFDRARGAR